MCNVCFYVELKLTHLIQGRKERVSSGSKVYQLMEKNLKTDAELACQERNDKLFEIRSDAEEAMIDNFLASKSLLIHAKIRGFPINKPVAF